MKPCPECAEEVQDEAKVCRFCGYDIERDRRPSAGRDAAGGCFKYGCAGPIAALVILGALGGTLKEWEDKKPASTSVQPGHVDQAALAKLVDEMSWTYERRTDDISGKTASHAITTSKNSVEFGSPYSGGSVLTMVLRKHPRIGTTASLSITKGQMLCDVSDGCNVTIRIDGGAARRFHAVEPADYDPTTIFIVPASRFIAAMKGAKSAIVEVEFYREGRRQFTFNVSNLKWPPPKQ